MAKSKGTYSVGLHVKLDVVIDVAADSLAEALEKSKSIKLEDVVDVLGDLNDQEIKVVAIYSSNILI